MLIKHVNNNMANIILTVPQHFQKVTAVLYPAWQCQSHLHLCKQTEMTAQLIQSFREMTVRVHYCPYLRAEGSEVFLIIHGEFHKSDGCKLLTELF